MYSKDILTENESSFSAGTDLIISLVALLTVLLAANQIELQDYKKKAIEQEAFFEKIRQAQMNVINEFAERYDTEPIKLINGDWVVPLSDSTRTQTSDIKFYNGATNQRIVFGTNILFDQGDAFLKEDGRVYIKTIAQILMRKKDQLREIRILGHADNTNSRRDKNYNLKLASQRAISVYSFLRDQGGIDPAEQIMSAASYGEYVPANRDFKNRMYNSIKLQGDNASDSLRAKNRRIEIALRFYEK